MEKQKKHLDLGGDLAEVRDRLEAWRHAHVKGSRFPQEMWLEIAALARVQGFSRVLHALRLNYTSLRRRLGGEIKGRRQTTPPRPAFVELGVAHTGSRPECTIEFEDHKGRKASIHIVDHSPADIVTIAKGLWRHRV